MDDFIMLCLDGKRMEKNLYHPFDRFPSSGR